MNGEGNRDGTPENYSENNSVEEPTEDVEIDEVRQRQIKNLLATLFVSRGVPSCPADVLFGARSSIILIYSSASSAIL
jgi:pullulanase/glycogen debranching enzyme